jgi:hypothetical protein
MSRSMMRGVLAYYERVLSDHHAEIRRGRQFWLRGFPFPAYDQYQEALCRASARIRWHTYHNNQARRRIPDLVTDFVPRVKLPDCYCETNWRADGGSPDDYREL